MNTEVLELDEDSDIEITFESTPVPKSAPPSNYHHSLYRVPPGKRQRYAFNPKPCSYCRREFRDKVTVARHTVRHHWKAVREGNYGKDKKGTKYFQIPDDREIQEPAPYLREPLPPIREPERIRGFSQLPPSLPSPPSSPHTPRHIPRPIAPRPLLPIPEPGTSALERDAAIREARDLLHHSSSCLRADRQADSDGVPPKLCTRSHCAAMKAVLEHLPSCSAGEDCMVQDCLTTKQIIRMAREYDKKEAKEGRKKVVEQEEAKKGAEGGKKPSEGLVNGVTSGVPRKGARPKTQLEEYRERMLKETGLVGAGGGGEKVQEDTGELGERPKAENGHRAHTGDTENRGSSDREAGSSSGKVSDNYSENGKEKRVQPPESSGPVDVLGGILSSQARTQEDRKAGPLVVDTKEGKVEVGGRSFPSIQYRGVQYNTGDFVLIRSESGGEPQIQRMERLMERDGIRTLLGRRFYHRNKMEISHQPSKVFFDREVARSRLQEFIPISRVLGKCYVMPLPYYHTHQPENIPEKDLYVCEFNYDPRTREWEKIEPAAFWKPPLGLKMLKRDVPLEAKRMEETQHSKRKSKPIDVKVGVENGDVLGSILGNLPKSSSSKSRPSVQSSPVAPSAKARPSASSDVLSGLLASQNRSLTITRKPVGGGGGGQPVTAQEAAEYNSMFSM